MTSRGASHADAGAPSPEPPELRPGDPIATGDRLRKGGEIQAALDCYLEAARAVEVPPASLCVRLARSWADLGDPQQALRWAAAVVDAGDDLPAWHAAAALVRRYLPSESGARRTARVAVVGSYTLSQYAALLHLPARRAGLALDVYEGAFGQYRQELLDPTSALWAFDPNFIILAVHERDLALPDDSHTPLEDVEAELHRWTSLWRHVTSRSRARVVQHTFVVPADPPLGHLAARRRGSRHAMIQALNLRLGEAAGDDVLLVDCERVAGQYGKRRWADPRYWHHAKQAVALGAVPLLARHTAAVLAGDVGLARKCLVLDLDNTLWGGVIGEDGLAGIRLGGTAEGEAYVAFQESLLALARKGVLLAVCSKNNPADAREPFERHPEMRLRLDDLAAFVAGWETKVEGIRTVAKELDLGVDALVFVDDNPAERQIVRQLLPEVDVLPLPPDPAEYSRALSEYLLFETSAFTADDRRRVEQYRARAAARALATEATSLEEFYRSLGMRAEFTPFDEVGGPRIAQLVAKTNQFNLTTRRHSAAQLAAFARDPHCLCCAVRLRDRFTDHGLVAVLIGRVRGATMGIDTWLMSCRVIGRTLEVEMLEWLRGSARARGVTTIEGEYIPTARNGLVADLYERLGFDRIDETADGATRWRLDVRTEGARREAFIELVEPGEQRT